jgi:acid phosphatase family membrane protein YuiD
VVLIFSLIVLYDAANVRYYAGRNIQLTQQLVKDIQTLSTIKLDDPIYLMKIKEVLGHQWFEVIGGVVLGLTVAGLMLFVR